MRRAVGLAAIAVFSLASPAPALVGTHVTEGAATVVWDRVHPGVTDPQRPVGFASMGARAVAVTPDGLLALVSGHTFNADFSVLRRTTLAYVVRGGAVLWVNDTPVDPGEANSDLALVVSPRGDRAFVSGGSGGQFATIALEVRTGKLSWSKPYGGDSLVMALGGDRLLAASPEIGTVALDPEDGDTLWSTDEGGLLAVSPDGTKAYVTSDDGTVALAASSGSLLWAAVPAGLKPRAVRATDDGTRVVIAGSVGPTSTTSTLNAATGVEQSRVARVDTGPEGFSIRREIVDSRGEKTYLVGDAEGPGESFLNVVTAYDTVTGASRWTRIEDDLLQQPTAAVVSPKGDAVYVTGFRGPHPHKFVTAGYLASNGARMWRASWDNGAWDFPFGVTTTPNGGRVLVTGRVTPEDGPPPGPFQTVAYVVRLEARLSLPGGGGGGAAIAPNREGVVPVTLLSTEDVAIDEIDLSTVRLGPGGAAPREDLTDPREVEHLLRDVDGDGRLDLSFHFPAAAAGLDCGDGELTLRALTWERIPVEASAMTKVVGCDPGAAKPRPGAHSRPSRGRTMLEVDARPGPPR